MPDQEVGAVAGWERMPLEIWFDTWQYETDYDIAESAVRFQTLAEADPGSAGRLGPVPLRYGHHAGLPALRDVVATSYPGRTAADVLVTNGASEALFSLFSAVVSPGAHVVVEHPNYPSLANIPRALGAKVELLGLRPDQDFRPDLDQLAGMIRPDTTLVVVTHPHNPTGSVINTGELERLADITGRAGAILLVDETYRHLQVRDVPPPGASLAEHVVSISTMSKCFGVAGLRLGWAVTANQDLLARMLAVREHTTISNTALSEHIGLHILHTPDAHLDRTKQIVNTNRDIAAEWIASRPDADWVTPQAGVVALPWLTGLTPAAADALFHTLAQQESTLVVPGRCFDIDHRHFRLGFGSTPDELREGLRRLGKLLDQTASS